MSLAITAMLLTATMVAIDASFKAYAAAVETASTQTATRMVVNRLLTLVRTATAHGPLLVDADEDWPVALARDDNGAIIPDTLESGYIEMQAQDGQFIRIEYRAGAGELWVVFDDDLDGVYDDRPQPLLSGVTNARFTVHRRIDTDGTPVLDRGTLNLTVETDSDNTLAIEGDDLPPIHVVASTMPRKLN